MVMEDPTKEGSAFALVVGIGRYRDERIRPLNYTHADAEAFAALLTDRRRCGLPPENVRILLDEDATLFNIKNGISGWLYQHATSECTVFVFFAGHGGVESDRTGLEPDGTAKYLIPWDANADNLFASALSNVEFHHLLNTIKAQRLVIFMDACYAGGVAQRGARDLGIVANPYERLAEGSGRLVIAAAQPNQRSWEDASIGHGIFTHHLIDALSGGADLNEDGCVSIMDVYKYLEKSVPKSARQLSRSEQEPLMFGNIASDIILTIDRERLQKARLREAENARRQSEEARHRRSRLFQIYDAGKLDIDTYRECLDLIDRPPDTLDDSERTLLGYLEAMLDERIDAALFLQTRSMISSRLASVLDAKAPAATARSESSQTVLPKFCFGCGNPLAPNRKFCIHCGRAVVETKGTGPTWR